MRVDELAGMPNVQALLADRGVTFDQSLVVNPLCCPARSTILTGGTSGQTGIWANFGHHGGFPAFERRGEESSTLATWLSSAGYATSLDGKYLNDYTSADIGHVPPGWSDWHALALGTGGSGGEGRNGYFQYKTSDNGVATYHGTKQSAYSTTVLGGDVVGFIRATPAGTPLFAEYAPRAPHWPALVEDAHLGGCTDVSGVPRSPAWNEPDVSDKPAYIATIPPATQHQIRHTDALYVRMCQTLLSVDDQVGDIVTALEDTGRLANSLIIFTSDNGIELLEHRWDGKNVPYEESIRVPLVIRYDPMTASQAGSHDHHLVQNLDLAPTIAAAAGVAAPGATGQNLLQLLSGDDSGWPLERLIEHWQPPGGVASPSFCGVRTAQYTYAQYATGEEELYDLSADPLELDNRAGDAGMQELRAQLHGDAMALCRPRPPQWPRTIR